MDSFNLEKQIAEWRQEMFRAGIRNREVLDELEAHLREQTARLIKTGTAGQEAFQTAVHQLGEGKTLNREFEKARSTKESKKERFMRRYCIVVSVSYLVLCSGALFKMHMSLTERILGLVPAALFALFIAASPALHHALPAIRNRRTNLEVQAAAILMCVFGPVLFMNLFLPRLNLSLNQVVITILWILAPFAVVASISHGLREAHEKRAATSDS